MSEKLDQLQNAYQKANIKITEQALLKLAWQWQESVDQDGQSVQQDTDDINLEELWKNMAIWRAGIEEQAEALIKEIVG